MTTTEVTEAMFEETDSMVSLGPGREKRGRGHGAARARGASLGRGVSVTMLKYGLADLNKRGPRWSKR